MKKNRNIVATVIMLCSLGSIGIVRADACTDTVDTDNQCNLRNVSNSCDSGCGSSNSCGNSCSSSCDSVCTGSRVITCGQCCRSILLTRSAHDNTAYRYLPFEHMADMCEFNGGFAIGYEFQQTFGSSDLARCLFNTKTLSFKGSQVVGRDASSDLIADYFGLSPLFVGSLTLCPQVQNQNLHFESYFGFDGWVEGLYLRADLTFCHQKRTLIDNGCNICSTNTVLTNTSAFPAGYMQDGLAMPATSLPQALTGTFLFGDMQTPWKFGRFAFCDLSDNKVAGFSIDLGYDFWRCEESHLGIFLRYSAPTGTKLNGSQKNAGEVFFPIIGNGHHHELGGGLTAHGELWSNDCGDNVIIYFDGYATHLFEDCQIRSFDFAGAGCMSRYMLLKELVPTGSTTNPTNFNYGGSLINGINFATRFVKSTIDVQGDASLRLIYNRRGFSLAIGYNIFGREEEKLCIQGGSPCNAVNPNTLYGLKGCEGVDYYCYDIVSTVNPTINSGPTTTTDNATASNATAFSCGTTDSPVAAGSLTGTGPFCVDWKNALYGSPAVQANAVPLTTNATSLIPAFKSVPAVPLSSDPATIFNIRSGKIARLLSNKGFVTIGYEWEECNWSPFVNGGLEVEGAGGCCDVKQWGVWLKGGFAF